MITLSLAGLTTSKNYPMTRIIVRYLHCKINGRLTFEHLTISEHMVFNLYTCFITSQIIRIVKVSSLQGCSFDKELGMYTLTYIGVYEQTTILMTYMCLEPV